METKIKGIAGSTVLWVVIAGCFAVGPDFQLLCGLLGAVAGTAIIQS